MINKLIYDLIEDMLCYKESLGFKGSSYKGFLYDFGEYLNENYPSIRYLTQEAVLNWCKQRDTEKPSSYRRRIGSLREFTKYLSAMGKCDFILSMDFAPRIQRYSPYIFTDNELLNIFKASDEIPKSKRSPNRELIVPVMIKLIYFCGLRPNEGRELLKEDILLDEGILHIKKNKSHSERRIPMSEDVLIMCRNYLHKLSNIYPSSTYFFPSPSGKPYSSKWLRIQFVNLWNEVKRENIARIRVYDLRHRYATTVLMKWLNEKKNLYVMLPYLSTYMGHSKLADTVYYIHLLPENLIKSEAIDWKHFSDLIPEVLHE